MTRLPTHKRTRSGVVLPLLGLMLVPLLAMVAFAVDVAYIVMSFGQLQHAADSCALAGAEMLSNGSAPSNPSKYPYLQQQLATPPSGDDKTAGTTMLAPSGYAAYGLASAPGANPDQPTVLSNTQANARMLAKLHAAYNSCGGVTSLQLVDADIEFGYTSGGPNATPPTTSYTYSTTGTGFTNTCKVTLRMDGSNNNGALNLFIAPAAFGVSTQNVVATAAATVMRANANNAWVIPPQGSVRILPFAFDINLWNAWADNLATNGGSSTLPIYPYNQGQAPGNFGRISMDQSHVGSSTISDWIQNGVPMTDLKGLVNGQLLPINDHISSNPLTTVSGSQVQAGNNNAGTNWVGEPGISDNDAKALLGQGSAQQQGGVDFTGQSFLMPLFAPVQNGSTGTYTANDGGGANAVYYIAGWVGVTLTSVTGNGKANLAVSVTPNSSVSTTWMMAGTGPAPFQPAIKGSNGVTSSGFVVFPTLTQ
jgi:hypothetical protein